MGDLDAIVAETQRVLQPIIAKPKLTEPLLKKPPFRFLHDIVTEVKKSTGFPAELTDTDLDSGNFKDKESKVAYLTKVIGLVTNVVGPITIKPQKIVAGMEPENTNAWLQGLAKACQGGGGAAPPPAPKAAPPPEEKKAPPAAPAEAPPQERPKPKRSEEEGQAAAEERPSKARGERTKKAPEQEREPQPETPTKKAPPPAAQPQPQAEDDDSNSRRMGRPTTARRAPPKVQSNVATKDTRPTSKQSELRPAVKVIAEGDAADDDDDDGDMSAVQVGAGQRGMGQARHDMDGDHGMLVKNMLQKEQALVNNDGQDHREDGAVSQHEDKERQRTLEEMMKLKESIQSLCQSTNPLARSMDYIQEDLDNMGKELDFWMKDKIVQTQKLEDEERKTEIELEALVSQLRAVEQSIMEEDLRIKDMKGSVLRNEETIKSMLGSVVRLAGQ